ncbi:ATP-binding cassette domain-containing protein [Hwanghaeella grinnelliae]|uniref:ATP-binding cassette domain-containing protein n=1 Tax=Hwanghaeella grinnelliae TaxID=2500179 RepID=A0A437QVN6_9PROT|nr:ATP-binding cassette domain-containing protein [Hwanghaeella grinnelliae]RVU38591.1 ATP-binding cassette domain-containing protein [Hwanghaeella grinnelliae]
MSPPILHLRDIHITFGGTPLLTGAELAVEEGARVCLVGRNGSGKSTLLKVAAGLLDPDGGEVFRQPGTTVAFLPQEPDFTGYATAYDYVAAGFVEGHDPHPGRVILEALGLTGDEDPATFSGGEARRCALARVLGPEPDILLLDEPTNHLDLSAIEWLEQELRGLRSAIVLISHDRRVLDTLSRETVWLYQGVSRKLDKGFKHFEDWRDTLVEQMEQEKHKLDRKFLREMEWLRRGVTARRKRNQGRLRALNGIREEKRNRKKVPGAAQMKAAEGQTSGKLVAEMKGVTKSFDGRAVIRDLDLRVQRGDRVGIVGPNGAGKTTLLKTLLGDLQPDSGVVRLGANLQIITLDQSRESLKPTWTLAEAITHGGGETVSVGGETKHVMGYLQDFLFSPEQVRTPISRLSGGERGRLMLARALAQPSNLMILDEPTNDLDLETLDLLQEMIGDYAGTVILVSHDRDFLDRTVSNVLFSTGDGVWTEYAGGYSDMAAQRLAARRVAAQTETEGGGQPGKSDAKKDKNAQGKPVQTGAKRKLSFNQQHALKTLPDRVAKTQTEVARLQDVLADPGLYANDPKRYETTATALGQKQAELEQLEEEWLELEILREEIEGN